MSDTETDIDGVYGNVHTGSGDLYSGPTVVMNLLRETTEYLRSSGMIPHNDLGWLNSRFVPPQRFGLARDRLNETRTVLLHGEVGSGRRSAAKMLLHELSDEASSFAEFAEEAAFPKSRLFPERVKPGQRLLLDLSHSSSDTLLARRRELPALRAVLDERDAYLAIVLPYGRQDWASEELAGYMVEIDRPSEYLVLRRHLAAAGIELSDQDELSPELARYLEGPLREIAELTELVRRVMRDNPGWSVSAWLHEALVAVTERREEAAKQVENFPEARQRAVLFAAAMCHDASPDAVFFAAQKLLERLDLTGREEPRLEQRGHRAQLKDLGVRVLDHGQRVGFTSFAYDRAVRSHFWENYPDLRSSFCTWIEEAICSESFTHRDRQRAVARFLDHALRTGCVLDVAQRIARWSNLEQQLYSGYWIRFAEQALVAGLRDEEHAASFRRLVYLWARYENLPQQVGQLIVHVCTEVIAPSFPDQAIVRLHQRARREGEPVEPSARQALRTLAEDRDMSRRVIARFATKFRNAQWWEIDLDLFVDVLDPTRLTEDTGTTKPLAAEPVVWSELVLGLRTVMTHRAESARWLVDRWLTAVGRSRNPDLLLRLLAEAPEYEPRALGALHVMARDWSRTAGGDPRVAERLTHLIDERQGLDRTDYTLVPNAEETRP
ncbi:hypothetical protein [Actinopolyspora mortivallis]|uniref:Uncharacterized protein n=1 Tax=Actinopolyspora mortivallis TaxID=33906 RepID=A0A2T0GS98_ACTMO|nr:hypothetical protein [Actinopolyspora mortivallis]PRW61971.1 hypothetical protein CEP50_17940 [Actinopolyspora mortivallis]